jgi:hypothetical protein
MKRSEAIRRAAIRQLGEAQQFKWLDEVLDAGTPGDPRTDLPLSERQFTQTTLPDGTLLTTWEDPPLGDDPLPSIPLPDKIDDHAPQTWRKDKPEPPTAEGWTGPIGPRPVAEEYPDAEPSGD